MEERREDTVEGDAGPLLGSSRAAAWSDPAGGKAETLRQSLWRGMICFWENIGSSPGREAGLGARQEGG